MYFSTCSRICLHSPIFCCYVFVLVLGWAPPPFRFPPWSVKFGLSPILEPVVRCFSHFFAMVRDLLQSTLLHFFNDGPWQLISRLWDLHSNVSTPTLQLFPSYHPHACPTFRPTPLSSDFEESNASNKATQVWYSNQLSTIEIFQTSSFSFFRFLVVSHRF